MMQTLEVLQLNDRVVWVWSKSLAVPFLRRICEFHMVTLCIIVQWQKWNSSPTSPLQAQNGSFLEAINTIFPAKEGIIHSKMWNTSFMILLIHLILP